MTFKRSLLISGLIMSKKIIKDGPYQQHVNLVGIVPELDVDIKKVSEEEALVTNISCVIGGSVDAGKSSFIGTMCTGLLDSGNGSARQTVARHKHEIESGKTSCISSRNLRLPNDKTLTLIDLAGHQKYFSTTAFGISGSWADFAILVVSPARGILDMTRQHFRMLVSYNIPIMIIVTKIDIALEDSCKITDTQIKELCDSYRRKIVFINNYSGYHSYKRGSTLVSEHELVNDPKFNFKPKHPIVDADTKQSRLSFTDTELDDINDFLNSTTFKLSAVNEISQAFKMVGNKQMYIPVVYLSNVDGYGLDIIKTAMMSIEPRDLWCRDENANSVVKFFRTKLDLPNLGAGADSVHVGSTFYIDNPFMVKGVGTVVSGVTRGETIYVNDELYLGPISKEFIKVKVRSIHNDKRDFVDSLANHHRGCICIKAVKGEIKKNQIGRGMVLISKQEMLKHVGYRFEAAITIFSTHSATLRTGYSPVINCGTICQAAKMILPEPDDLTDEQLAERAILSRRELNERAQQKLKSGDVAKVTFKFRMRPEYVDPGAVFVFRSGDIHGVGCVISVLSLDKDDDAAPEPVKSRFRKMRPVNQNKKREALAKKQERIVVAKN